MSNTKSAEQILKDLKAEEYIIAFKGDGGKIISKAMLAYHAQFPTYGNVGWEEYDEIPLTKNVLKHVLSYLKEQFEEVEQANELMFGEMLEQGRREELKIQKLIKAIESKL